jgi:DTW domain-containing protein YfiP
MPAMKPTNHAPGRAFCYRCHKEQSLCVCALVVPLSNRTHVHVIQHPRERHNAIGTVRLVRLGLARCSVEVNWPWSGQPSRLSAAPPEGAAVLFPSDRARPVEALAPHERPHQLIVLDGTWHQARTLYRNNAWLEALPHVLLDTPVPSRYRIRAEPKRHYLSTVEAIVRTLGILEPELEGREELLEAFDRMIDAQVERAAVRHSRGRRRPEQAPTLRGDVLVHAETVGPPDARRIVHLCGLRLATGERFEGFAHPVGPTAPRKIARTGLGPEEFASAVPEEELRARWEAFLRPGDVLTAWSARALFAVGAADGAVLLKTRYCNTTSGPAGDLTDIIARHGLIVPAPLFAGRAGACMARALAIRAALEDGSLSSGERATA